jgi:antitoxin VapB
MHRKIREKRSRSSSVAEPAPPEYSSAKARVFQSGNSQAVRLPKQFRLRGKEVEIFRRGSEIVLREKPPKLRRAFAALPAIPDDALPDDIPDHPAEPLPKL